MSGPTKRQLEQENAALRSALEEIGGKAEEVLGEPQDEDASENDSDDEEFSE